MDDDFTIEVIIQLTRYFLEMTCLIKSETTEQKDD